jgi:hypothetical protein
MSDLLKYVQCDFCGQEKECFIHHELGEEQSVCPDCFSIADFD